MIIVTGHLTVEPARRTAYLQGCVAVVEAARQAPGCLDFAISADLLDPGRVLVVERWASAEAVEAFRGGGPTREMQGMVESADVTEYVVTSWRSLTG